MKNVLVFGAGRVAGPCVQYLLKKTNFKVIVVDKNLESARNLVDEHPRLETRSMQINEAEYLIGESDLVISLLPAFLHETVIDKCAEHKTHVIFPYYITPEIERLRQKVENAGITALGEIGLDPGIDHMSAVKIINEVKDKDGQIDRFGSWCGGLSAPESANTPIRYKFSWSPIDVIDVSKLPARYLENGNEVEIAGDDLMKSYLFKYVPNLGWYEDYPNSDTIPYIEYYNIPEVRDIYRGTFRYPGWCETMANLNELGMFSSEKEDLSDTTFLDYTCKLINASKNTNIAPLLASYLGVPDYSLAIKNIQWLGLLDDLPIPFSQGAAKDILAHLLLDKLEFEENERDLVVMRHEFDARYPNGKKETITSTLVEYGEPGGFSAMAKTTGFPIGIAAKLIVNKDYAEPGFQLPVQKNIYMPILEELREIGIEIKDSYSNAKY